MKKQLFLISLIFAMFVAYGQEVTVEPTSTNDTTSVDSTMVNSFCPHKIWLHFGGAFTNNIYNRYNDVTPNSVDQKYSNIGLIEVGYSYFFTKNWGLGIGVSLSNLRAKAVFGGSGVIEDFVDDSYIPNPGETDGYSAGTYDLYYEGDNFSERQNIWAIEIPLIAQFQTKFGGRHGIYADLGVKGYFPFSARTNFNKNEGTITTSGYDEYPAVAWPSTLSPHFGVIELTTLSSKTKLRCSIDLQADFGGIIGLSKTTDLYIGAYCSYGFLDILPKSDNKETLIHQDYISAKDGNFVVNGLTNHAQGKWHLLQVGMKIGFHFNACGNKNDDESMKDLKKKYMKEMMKKANDPIIIKTTEYVYIVPVCPEEDENQTKEQKENIKALAEILSNTKILFDLDKDIPKISEYNDNINRTVDILKKDPSLKLIVEGYTCDLGSEEHNRDLANRRANKIRDLFISKGVPADQIEIASYTVNDPQNARNIPDSRREEHRAAIFRIVTR